MAGSGDLLRGLRILVVEDNFLAAELLRDFLEGNGATVVGPTGRIDQALTFAANEAIDGALLDINLNGARCFPIAEALRARGVPFMFLTGYDDGAVVPAELRPARLLGKPISEEALIAAVCEQFCPVP